MDYVTLLPPELTEEIFSYLPVRDLIVCGAVCVSWRVASNNLHLWKKYEKNFESWLLPDSKVKRCDVITSSFSDKSRSLQSIMPKDNLSPFNPFKVFVCQRNFLKHNWTHGIYADHYLVVEGCSEYRFFKAFYPSKSAHDCLYYPFKRRLENRSYGFFLIRLDAKPKVAKRLFTTNDPESVRCMSLMRDCVVWLNGENVEYFSLTSELEKSEVQTIGTLELVDHENGDGLHDFLTMDADHIVAVSLSLKIWCKLTLTLKFVYNPQSGSIPTACYLYDGCLINAYEPIGDDIVSCIKIFNIKIEVSSSAQNELTVDGPIENIVCNKCSIILYYYNYSLSTYNIQVRDKETYTIKFSYCDIRYFLDVRYVNNEVIYLRHPDSKIELLNFITGECHVMTQFNGELHFLFDNIAVYHSETSVDVWDWVKNVKVYSLKPKYNDDPSFIVHVSDARLVTTDYYCNFKIHGFG